MKKQDTSELADAIRYIGNSAGAYLDYLPFKRLSEHFRDHSEFHFGSVCDLMYRETLGCVETMAKDTRIHVIPVVRTATRGLNGHAEEIAFTEIIIRKETAAGGYLVWNLHQAKFEVNENSVHRYSSSSSVIRHYSVEQLAEELCKVDLPSDFVKYLNDKMREWISAGITARSKIIKELLMLKKKFPLPERTPVRR